MRDVSDAGSWPGKVARITRGAGTLMLYASLTHYFARRAAAWWDGIAIGIFALGTVIAALFVADAGLNLAAPGRAGAQSPWHRLAAMAVLIFLGGLVSFLVMAKLRSGS